MRKIFIIVFAFLSLFVDAQTFNPSLFTVTNKSLGVAQAVPTDARSQFWDNTNFVARDYNGTTEVLSYLNLAKYRSGGFPVYVHSGGVLNGNGTYTGGVRLVYWFKDSTGNANLVRWYTDSIGIAGSYFAIVNNLSEGNPAIMRTNLGLGSMATLNSTASGDLSGIWPNITAARFNGQLPSYYLNWNNLTNTPVGLSLTTTGSSGVATYNSGTGILNIPNYAGGGGGSCVNCNADTIAHIFLDASTIRNGYVITLDSVNGKFILAPAPGSVGSGITTLNGLSVSTQSFATGTLGTDFNISSASSTHTFNFPSSSGSNRGLLTAADWTAFNAKQAALSGTGYVKFSGTTPSYLTPTQATADLNLFTSSLQGLAPASGGGTTNFLRADGTWAAPPGGGSAITALTGDVVATGPGSVSSLIQANAITTTKILNNAVTLGKMATGTSNYLIGYDGSGNPTALAPDTLFVKNRVSGTGVQLGNISNDTLYLNNLVAGSNIILTKQADSSILIAATGGGGSQTFQQTLTTGRTLANSDSILHAGFALYHKGGLLRADSLHIAMSNGTVIDTIVFFGPSTVVGVGASSNSMRWSTKVSQRLGAIEKNLGVNSQMIINQTPFNPFGAVTTGLGDTIKIPTYVAGKHRYLIESWFKNDIAYSASNYDTVAYKSALRLWLNAAIRKGWPLSIIYLSSDGPEGQSAWNTDSVVYSLPAAANAARCALFDDALKKLAIEYSIGFIDQYSNFIAYSNPALHLSADSIHENDPAYGYEANYAIAQLGYDIKNIGQQLAVNGITDLDSARLHLTIPPTTSNYTSVVIDSVSRLKGCTNCFLMNSPLQAQPFIGNTSQGIVSGWAAPGWIRITGASGIIPSTGIPGVPLTGEALEIQFNPTNHQGYISPYNRTTLTALPLNLVHQGNYLVVGSGLQANSGVMTVAGIATVTGALWAGSTRLLSGFIDQTTASSGLTFRVDASSKTALTLNADGSSTFFTPTSATPSIVLPAGTKPTSMGQGALAAATGHLWYHDGSTDYDLLSSSGGFANPMSAPGQMIYGGTAGAATATATPAHAGMRPIWNGTAIVFTDTTAGGGSGQPGGSNQNIQVKSGSSFYGAGNLNYDTTNLWTLVGASPLVATGTGAAAAGDIIVKANQRWVTSATTTTNTASFGITSGLIGEFRNYFSNGAAVDAWDFYTPAGGSTGTQVKAFGITSGGYIFTGAGTTTYGTPVAGDFFMNYGGRIVSGTSATIFSSIGPNIAGMTELKNAYNLGSIDFYTSHGTAGSSTIGLSLSTAGNLIVAGSKTDNSNGLIQALSTSQAQLTLENTSSLYGSVQVNSAGSWGWRHMTGFTLPSAALAAGTSSDSVLAIRTSASGIDTLVKILQPAGGGSGVTTVGTFSNTANANGLDISSVTLTAHAADATNPGMIKASGSQTLGPILTLPAPLFTSLTVSGTTDSTLTVNPSNGQVRYYAASGTYTPTLTNTTNITTSGTNSIRWTRSGGVIHVVIAGTLQPTLTATNTTLTVTLPFNTSTTTGVAVGQGTVSPNAGSVLFVAGLAYIGSSSTVDFKFYFVGTTTTSPYCVSFDYEL